MRACSVFFCLALLTTFCDAGSLGKSGLGSVPYSSTGKTVSFGEGALNASTVAGRAPPQTGQIGQSGWYYGTGAAVNPASGQTMTMGANGDVFIAGTKYPFQAGYQVPVKDVAVAALGLVGGWPGLAISGALVLAPHIKDWLDGAGVKPNPDSKGEHDRFLQRFDRELPKTMFDEATINACNQHASTSTYEIHDSTCSVRAKTSCGEGKLWYELYYKWGFHSGGQLIEGTYSCASSCYRELDAYDWLPKSLDDIAPYLLRTPFNPAMVGDIVQGGGSIPLPEPNITGPTSIQGQPETSTSTGTQTVNGQQVPTRTETTTQTTYNFTTNNNQVTNTTNNTTTTTNTYNQSTGVLISTDFSEKTEKPEEQEQVADSPLGPLPKLYEQKYPDGLSGVWTQRSQDFKSSGLFSLAQQMMPTSLNGGSCPNFNLDLSIGPWADYGTHEVPMPCWIWDTCKYILLLMAAVSARRIVFGG